MNAQRDRGAHPSKVDDYAEITIDRASSPREVRRQGYPDGFATEKFLSSRGSSLLRMLTTP